MHREIVEYLKPLLGEATANNLVRHYCARMRMSPEEIQPLHLPDLAEAMKPMLAVWLGSGGAARVAQDLAQLAKGVTAR